MRDCAWLSSPVQKIDSLTLLLVQTTMMSYALVLTLRRVLVRSLLHLM